MSVIRTINLELDFRRSVNDLLRQVIDADTGKQLRMFRADSTRFSMVFKDGENDFDMSGVSKISLEVKPRACTNPPTPTMPLWMYGETETIPDDGDPAIIEFAAEETALPDGGAWLTVTLYGAGGEVLTTTSGNITVLGNGRGEFADVPDVEDARDEAIAAANRAESARDAAEGYRDQAQTASGTATTARNQAVAAKSDAESARDQANTARNQAQTAQGAAEGARDAAQGYRNEALSFRNAAQGAATAATDEADRAEAEADRATTQANRSEGQADRAQGIAASLASAAPALSYRGVRSDGTAPALLLPAQDFALDDFYFRAAVIRSACRMIVISNRAGDAGLDLLIEADGRLTLRIGTHSWTTAGRVKLPVGSVMDIVVSLRRTTVASVFVNGWPLLDPQGAPEVIDISASSSENLSTGAPWRLLSDGEQHSAGTVLGGVAMGFGIIDATAVLLRSRDPSLWQSDSVPIRAIGFASFSAGDPVWYAIEVTPSSGSMTIGQSAAGHDDWALYQQPTEGLGNAAMTLGGQPDEITRGRTVVFSFEVYFPADQRIDGVRPIVRSTAGQVEHDFTNQFAALGTGKVHRIVASRKVVTQINGANLRVHPIIGNPGSAGTQAGNDRFYLRNFYYGEAGSQMFYDLTAPGLQKPDRIATGSAHYVLNTGVRDTDAADEVRLAADVAEDGWFIYDQSAAQLFDPAAWYIAAIYCRASSAITGLGIGTAAGNSAIVAPVNLTAGQQTMLTLANPFPTTGKLHVHATAWAGSVTLTITLKRKA